MVKYIVYILFLCLVLMSRGGALLPSDFPDGEQHTAEETGTESVTESDTVEETGKQIETETESDTASNTVGMSDVGYPIEQVDGLTYVGGVLVVNKSYSLPSWYNVGDLTPETAAAFSELREAARLEGLSIYCISGFRSYQTQNSVYWNYVSRDGQELADTYSARPGHSEHQTGLALDVNSLYTSFGDTAEGIWLAEHCHEYGFIIRYPADKVDITGYMYEPWHIRYVGKYIAGEIKAHGICLEEYLGVESCYE